MLFHVHWQSWERGCEEIEVATEEEARKLFDDRIGSLEPTSEGIDIVDVDVDGEDGADKYSGKTKLVRVELIMTSTSSGSAVVRVPVEATNEQIEEAANDFGWALEADAGWGWSDDYIEARSIRPVEEGQPDITLHFDGDELTTEKRDAQV
jgi:hypothetical protein